MTDRTIVRTHPRLDDTGRWPMCAHGVVIECEPCPACAVLYDTDAPQPSDYYDYLAHKLIFPRVRRWEEIVAAWTDDPEQRASFPEYALPRAYATAVDWVLGRLEAPAWINPYMRLELGRAGVAGYVPPRYVELQPVCAENLMAGVLHVPGDRMTFAVIAWSPARALVLLSHSLILGDYWLAVIDPSTIPFGEGVLP